MLRGTKPAWLTCPSQGVQTAGLNPPSEQKIWPLEHAASRPETIHTERFGYTREFISALIFLSLSAVIAGKPASPATNIMLLAWYPFRPVQKETSRSITKKNPTDHRYNVRVDCSRLLSSSKLSSGKGLPEKILSIVLEDWMFDSCTERKNRPCFIEPFDLSFATWKCKQKACLTGTFLVSHKTWHPKRLGRFAQRPQGLMATVGSLYTHARLGWTPCLLDVFPVARDTAHTERIKLSQPLCSV